MAKIAAAAKVAFRGGMGNGAGLREDLFVKDMREMMLANDDFDVDAHFTVAAENFDDASGGSDAGVRETRQFNVDDGAIELRQAQTAAGARQLAGGGAELLLQFGRELGARRNDDFVGDARFVRENDIAVRAITKQADDSGIGAFEDFFDAAFEASVGTATTDAREDSVAVEGVAHGVGTDEEIAFHAANRTIGNDETIAIAMSDEATGN